MKYIFGILLFIVFLIIGTTSQVFSIAKEKNCIYEKFGYSITQKNSISSLRCFSQVEIDKTCNIKMSLVCLWERDSKNLAKGAGLLDQALIAELKAAGVKFTEADLKWIFKRGDGKIMFLENGNASAGFEHILSHKNDFIAKGIAEGDISDFVMSALKENKIVGYQGSGTGRPIYEVVYKGTSQRVAITTGSNGFVVGANPKSF